MTTLVTVGNAPRPFTRLLDLVIASADELPKPIVVQHGPARFDDKRCEAVEKLVATEYRRRLEASSLVICHAGQGALLEAAALGKPIVTLPRLARLGEHIDDHQIEFAEYFVERGWAVMPREGESLTEAAARARPPLDAPSPNFDKLALTVTGIVNEEATRRGLRGSR